MDFRSVILFLLRKKQWLNSNYSKTMQRLDLFKLCQNGYSNKAGTMPPTVYSKYADYFVSPKWCFLDGTSTSKNGKMRIGLVMRGSKGGRKKKKKIVFF